MTYKKRNKNGKKRTPPPTPKPMRVVPHDPKDLIVLPEFKIKQKYSFEQMDLIFNYIEQQITLLGRSVKSILLDPNTPHGTTFFNWLKVNPSHLERYAQALRSRADFWADEILEISDQSNLDYFIDKNGNIQVSGEAVARSRLKVDSRKWLMAKMNPAKYGDHSRVELTGAGGGSIKVETFDYSNLSDELLNELLSANKPNKNAGSDDPNIIPI